MSEEESAIKEMMNMTQAELDLVQFTFVKYVCSGKNCKRHTKVRDYGISPIYFHGKMTTSIPADNSKGFFETKDRWHDVTRSFFMCAKHFTLWKRLIKNYPDWHVAKKLFDLDKPRIQIL